MASEKLARYIRDRNLNPNLGGDSRVILLPSAQLFLFLSWACRFISCPHFDSVRTGLAYRAGPSALQTASASVVLESRPDLLRDGLILSDSVAYQRVSISGSPIPGGVAPRFRGGLRIFLTGRRCLHGPAGSIISVTTCMRCYCHESLDCVGTDQRWAIASATSRGMDSPLGPASLQLVVSNACLVAGAGPDKVTDAVCPARSVGPSRVVGDGTRSVQQSAPTQSNGGSQDEDGVDVKT